MTVLIHEGCQSTGVIVSIRSRCRDDFDHSPSADSLSSTSLIPSNAHHVCLHKKLRPLVEPHLTSTVAVT